MEKTKKRSGLLALAVLLIAAALLGTIAAPLTACGAGGDR